MTRRASPVAGRSLPWQGLDEDRRNALLLYGLIGAVVIFALALIGWGYYQDRIAPSHDTVLEVGERKFDLAFVQRRIEADIRAQGTPQANTLQDLVVATIQRIELEEITREAAREMGMTVTEAEIDAEIRQRLGLPEDVSREAFAAAYRREVLRVGLPVKEYREIMAAQIIQLRLDKQYKEAIPSEAEQVDAQFLRVSAESKAQEAKQRVDNGERFGLITVEMSIDKSRETGGQIGWVTREEIEPNIAEALFTLLVGQVSDPIQDRGGWYLVMARGREVREIDDAQKQRISNKSFDNLVRDTRDRVGSSTDITEEQILRIGRNVLKPQG